MSSSTLLTHFSHVLEYTTHSFLSCPRVHYSLISLMSSSTLLTHFSHVLEYTTHSFLSCPRVHYSFICHLSDQLTFSRALSHLYLSPFLNVHVSYAYIMTGHTRVLNI